MRSPGNFIFRALGAVPIKPILTVFGAPRSNQLCKIQCDRLMGFWGPKIACSQMKAESSIILHCTTVHVVHVTHAITAFRLTLEKHGVLL
jgi:hypothetical protein